MHPQSSFARCLGAAADSSEEPQLVRSCRTAPADLLFSLFPLHVTSSAQRREVALRLRMVAVAPLGPRSLIPNVNGTMRLFAEPANPGMGRRASLGL